MSLSGIVSDSDAGIHPSESNEVKTDALSKLTNGNAVVSCGQCANGSSTKRTGDFDKYNNLIDDSVFYCIHPNLTTGIHTCTAMNNFFSSMFES